MIRYYFLLLLSFGFIGWISSTHAEEYIKDFDGKWSPRPLLVEFWKPVQQEWWGRRENYDFYYYCKEFAKKTTPEQYVPEFIKDLAKNPSEARYLVYLWVTVNYPREQTLRAVRSCSKIQGIKQQGLDELIYDIKCFDSESARVVIKPRLK